MDARPPLRQGAQEAVSERDPLNVAHDILLSFVRSIAKLGCEWGCLDGEEFPCENCRAKQTLRLVEKLEPWEFTERGEV
jgi:hypothetical protein